MKNLKNDMSKSWADYWEALLSICKSAVNCEQYRMAAFFFPVKDMQEYVLGPHWLADSFDKAPFIRASVQVTPWKHIHNAAHGMVFVQENLKLYKLNDEVLFCNLENGSEISAVQTGLIKGDFLACWKNLSDFISLDAPDLNPE